MKSLWKDVTRKAIIERKTRYLGQPVSSYVQTDPVKAKLVKDQWNDNQLDMINPVEHSTTTEIEWIAFKSKDGTGDLNDILTATENVKFFILT